MLSDEPVGAARDLDICEENGLWVVRVIAPSDELSVQEYRCASEDVARSFATRILSARSPPQHGAVARAHRPDSGPWWWRRRH